MLRRIPLLLARAVLPLVALLGACEPAVDATTVGTDSDTDAPGSSSSSTDASTSAPGNRSSPSTSSDETTSDETTSDEPGSDGTTEEPGSSSDEGTTSSDDEACTAYCEVLVDCGDPGAADCVEGCQLRRRFREENFDDACQASTEASHACIATLTCEQLEDYGCEDVEIEEYYACLNGGIAQPGLASYCTLVADCPRTSTNYDQCVDSMLEYNIRSTYELDCVAEYEAVLACLGGLTCAHLDDEALFEASCPEQLAAFDAACPTFGQD